MPDYDPKAILAGALRKLDEARARLLRASLTVDADAEVGDVRIAWQRGATKQWEITASFRGGDWSRAAELTDEGKLAACAALPQLEQAVRAAFERRARAAGLLPEGR